MKLILGGIAEDERGSIRFVNDFNMEEVKRFYIIQNQNTTLVRGWRAHRLEQRWFFALSGGFQIDVVKIDNWDAPSRDLPVASYQLNEGNPQVMHVPAGHGTAVRALEAGSQLLVYADAFIQEASQDNYVYPADHFINSNFLPESGQ